MPDEQPEPGPAHAAAASLQTFDILPAAGASAEGRRRAGPGPWTVLAVLGVVLAMVAVGGLVVGLRALSGGGSQPEDVLPASAFAFAKLDLDPPAGQKVDAVRFLRTFPQTSGSVGDGTDLRKAFFDLVAGTGGLHDVDYAKDVKPWLGQRIGVAALPPATGTSGPTVVLALQVGDSGRAKAGLGRLSAAAQARTSRPIGYVVSGGWALIAPDTAQAKAEVAAAKHASLHSSSTYQADVRRVGTGALVTFWADLGRAQKAAAGLGASLGLPLTGTTTTGSAHSSTSTGRVAWALRFADARTLELVGSATGLARPAQAPTPTALAGLPASTVAAVGASGLGAKVDALWPPLRSVLTAAGGSQGADAELRQLQKTYGVTLPRDLVVLLGQDLQLAVDGTGMSSDTAPSVGVRVRTDPVRGTALATRLAKGLGGVGLPASLAVRRTTDGYVLSTSAGQAAKLAGSGTLGQRADFRAALPDAADAQVAVWVDADAFAGVLGSGGPHDGSRALAHVDGIGLTAVQSGGTATFRLRVVTR